MSIGSEFPSETTIYRDPITQLPVRKLTDYKGHHHHLYFTNNGWWAGGKELLIGGDRNGRTNLYSVRLIDGRIRQLTDLPDDRRLENSFLFAALNPHKDELYFWWNGCLHALELQHLKQRVLFEAPPGMAMNMTNVTADGKAVCTGLYEDLSHKLQIDLLHGYVGFREYHETRPKSQIWSIPTDGSSARIVFEENYWIGHVNTSPRHAHLLTYCHEGPWDKVDNRIWALDLKTGKNWKVRPTAKGEQVGHEYWLQDGETIGYHGSITQNDGGKMGVFGFVRFDNSELIEAPFPADSHHFHSNQRSLIVGDGSHKRGVKDVLLWTFDGHCFQRPRILCRHGSSAHIQQTHVHPRFSPDGRDVVFTSDKTGYGCVYLAELPTIDSLPLFEQT